MGGACISFLFSMVWSIWVLHFWRGFSAFVKGVAFFFKIHEVASIRRALWRFLCGLSLFLSRE